MEILNKLKNLVRVNGTSYNNTKTLQIRDGQVIINGEVQNQIIGHEVNVEVHGDVEVLNNGAGDIKVNGQAGSVKTGSGDIQCGDVTGNVRTGSGDVDVKGPVGGSVKTGSGDVTHRS